MEDVAAVNVAHPGANEPPADALEESKYAIVIEDVFRLAIEIDVSGFRRRGIQINTGVR